MRGEEREGGRGGWEKGERERVRERWVKVLQGEFLWCVNVDVTLGRERRRRCEWEGREKMGKGKQGSREKRRRGDEGREGRRWQRETSKEREKEKRRKEGREKMGRKKERKEGKGTTIMRCKRAKQRRKITWKEKRPTQWDKEENKRTKGGKVGEMGKMEMEE